MLLPILSHIVLYMVFTYESSIALDFFAEHKLNKFCTNNMIITCILGGMALSHNGICFSGSRLHTPETKQKHNFSYYTFFSLEVNPMSPHMPGSQLHLPYLCA